MANVNSFHEDIFNHVYALRPEAAELGEIRQSKDHYAIHGHRFWYQSKAHIELPVSG